MQVEIITIGNEILIGQVVDTNSAWMGSELNKHGFDVARITTVSDQPKAITMALNEAKNRVDVVLMTGGLGPTRDDITKTVLCQIFNTKLVFNQLVYNDVAELLKGRVSTINQLNRDQAMVPENCTVIRNTVGTAPILWFHIDGKVIVAMPGVPSEMKNAMELDVIPRLSQLFKTDCIIHKTVHIFQIPESVLAEMLTNWEDQLPDFINVAYLPQPGRIRLRLTGKGKDERFITHTIDELVQKLMPIVGEYIFGFDDDEPQIIVGKLLSEKMHTLAIAESCSGGMISALITSIAGSSVFFKGAVVAYSNDIKNQLLNVDSSTINQFGAVSKEVVEQMALGAQQKLASNWAIATSGIAGPTGGTDEKPTGTVWIAIARPDKTVVSEKYLFGKIREKNIKRTSDTALFMLLNEIKIFKV